jgi:hypothetical protein
MIKQEAKKPGKECFNRGFLASELRLQYNTQNRRQHNDASRCYH